MLVSLGARTLPVATLVVVSDGEEVEVWVALRFYSATALRCKR